MAVAVVGIVAAATAAVAGDELGVELQLVQATGLSPATGQPEFRVASHLQSGGRTPPLTQT